MADKKKNPYVIAGVSLLTIGITGTIIYFGYNAWKSNQAKKNEQDGKLPPVYSGQTIADQILNVTPSNCKLCKLDASFPLKKGSQGKQIAALQYVHNLAYPNSKLSIDGDWGNRTETGLVKLAKKYGYSSLNPYDSAPSSSGSGSAGGGMFGGALETLLGGGSASGAAGGGSGAQTTTYEAKPVVITESVYRKNFKKYESI